MSKVPKTAKALAEVDAPGDESEILGDRHLDKGKNNSEGDPVIVQVREGS